MDRRLVYHAVNGTTFYPDYHDAKRRRKAAIATSQQLINPSASAPAAAARTRQTKQSILSHEKNLQIQAAIWSTHLFAPPPAEPAEPADPTTSAATSADPTTSAAAAHIKHQLSLLQLADAPPGPDPVLAELAASVPVTCSVRKKLYHPLERFPEEVSLWIYDEISGSVSSEARAALNLPADTIERAAWRNVIAMEQSVLSMSVKDKRRLYLLMRHLTGGGRSGVTIIQDHGEIECVPSTEEGLRMDGRTEAAANTSEFFVPKMGMTLGQLSAFHILLTRTKFIKTKDLVQMVEEAPLGHIENHHVPLPISIEGMQ